MTRKAFERLVRQVMQSLPEKWLDQMENVSILVRDEPGPEAGRAERDGLLGIYLGVPQTDRDSGYGMTEPDRIVLYQRPLEARAESRAELRRDVKRTLLHEIAHHFGISDEELLSWSRY